jgi:pyruvate/2-oxoglutarate dehydrogenase complex dihydrolipoamide acyltransferase (E2) component
VAVLAPDRLLARLNEVGMALVETLDPRREPKPAGDVCLSFCNLARAVRLNIILDLRLDALARGEIAAPRTAAAESEPHDPPDPAPRAERGDRPERLDRLDREPDEIARALRAPLPELAGRICRDLGLSPEETVQAQAPFEALAANDDATAGAPSPSAETAGFPAPDRRTAMTRPAGSRKASLLASSAPLGP